MTKKRLSYQDAVNEIEEILSQLEQEALDVDDLSEKVKRVSDLIRLCRNKLRKTEEEVEKILSEMDE